MRTAKDILIVILLMVLVTMTCWQEDDILNTKHRVFMLAGGLQHMYGGLRQHLSESQPTIGGLAPVNGGLGAEPLLLYRACSAVLSVSERPTAPIMFGANESYGTGVFVSDNVLLTAKHVIEDRINSASVRVTGPDGVTYTAVEILEDNDDDIAVVIVQGRSGPWMDVGPWPSLGDVVTCIGNPLPSTQQLIITWGRVSSENYKSDPNTFIYDGFCWPGCSGGPIIVDGKVVGIVESRLNYTASLGFGVPVDRLDPDLLARIR